MIRTQFLTPNAVRISHAFPDGSFPADRVWQSHILLPQQALSPDEAALVVTEENGCVVLQTKEGLALFSEARPPCFNVHRTRCALVLDMPKTEIRFERERITDGIALSLTIHPDESFYGWGEWFDQFRRTRGTLQLKTKDAIALIQQRATYSAIPCFLSSRGYGFLLLNSHPSTFNINAERGTLEIQADGPNADYVVIYGPAFRDILTAYTALTGRPPLVPRWAFGLFVTGYPQEHQQIVLERVREHRRRNIPLDAVILDYHWEERFHNFQWRSSLFPDPPSLISNLQSLGVRLGVILTPFLNSRNRPVQKFILNALARNVPRGHEHDDERALTEYDEAKAKGYLAHPNAKWWLGAGGMFDFTNRQAADWWNRRLRSLYEQGIAFIKNDDGEYLPPDAASSSGMNGREYHNLYGFFYSRALYQGQAALDDRRPFIYARSAWVGSQRFPALFLGDQQPTFAHLRSTLRAGLNMSLLGFAYWTADVFGLDGQTTPETHMRYAQWALLVPIARYFWRPPAIDDTRFPWSHNAQVEANFRKYADLRYRLLPYYYALAWEAYQTGLPILRPLVLEFQNDSRLAGIYDQVLLGDRVMLAPVVEPGATTRPIVLPPGTWYDFWSGQSYEGASEMVYDAPLDRLPILVRGGCILPMGPSLTHIANDHRFDQLTLHGYPPYPARCVLYDDDGLTRAYQRGDYALTHLTITGDQRCITVDVSSAQGNLGRDERRKIEMVLHHCQAIARVQVNQQAWTDWSYDAEMKQGSVVVENRIDHALTVQVFFVV